MAQSRVRRPAPLVLVHEGFDELQAKKQKVAAWPGVLAALGKDVYPLAIISETMLRLPP